MDALNQAIKFVGGPSKLLAELKKRPGREKLELGHLWHWRKPNVPVPMEYCPEIEVLCEHTVTCEQLNPDVDWRHHRALMLRIAAPSAVGEVSDA